MWCHHFIGPNSPCNYLLETSISYAQDEHNLREADMEVLLVVQLEDIFSTTRRFWKCFFFFIFSKEQRLKWFWLSSEGSWSWHVSFTRFFLMIGFNDCFKIEKKNPMRRLGRMSRKFFDSHKGKSQFFVQNMNFWKFRAVLKLKSWFSARKIKCFKYLTF